MQEVQTSATPHLPQVICTTSDMIQNSIACITISSGSTGILYIQVRTDLFLYTSDVRLAICNIFYCIFNFNCEASHLVHSSCVLQSIQYVQSRQTVKQRIIGS